MMAVEIFFYVLFFIEWLMRLQADRCPKWMYDKWNWLDFTLIVLSTLDLVTLFALQEEESDVSGFAALRLLKNLRVIKLLRILRVLRIVRLLRLLRDLIVLMRAIIAALKGLAWVCLLLSTILYMTAVLTTEFLGIGNTEEDPQ